MSSYELPILHGSSQYSIRRGRRYPAERSNIGVHDIFVRLQELLNFLPPHSCFVQPPIAHCITRAERLHERCFDSREHELNKRCGLAGMIADIDGIVVFLLAVMDNGFYRPPCKRRGPLGEQERMPQAANTTVSVTKGMDQLKFIVEHAAPN